MTLLEELLHDHDHLRSQMSRLESGVPDPESLRRFFAELPVHAHLEDELLFAELESSLPPGDGPLAVMRAEHEQIESGLAGISSLSPGDADLPHRLRRLFAVARDHFAKEEQVLFAFAERLVERDRLVELGARFRERRGAVEPAPAGVRAG
jgi:hemerythrin-like domain-containing protein